MRYTRAWIVQRARGAAYALESPIGWMPRHQDLVWKGLEDFSEADFHHALSLDRTDWDAELLAQEELFIRLHDRLPGELRAVRELIQSALWRSPDHWEINPDPT